MSMIGRAFKAAGTTVRGWIRVAENQQINDRADDAAENAKAAADKVSIATADTAGNLAVLRKEVGKYEKEVADWTQRMNLAKGAGNMDLARKAAKEVVQAQGRLDSVKTQYDTVKARVENFKSKAEDAQDAAEDAVFTADQIKARNKMADAEKGVHDALHGANGTGVSSSLSELDKLVTQKEGRNEALNDMSGASTDAEFKKLQEQAAIDALLNGGASSEPAPADAGIDYKIAG